MLSDIIPYFILSVAFLFVYQSAYLYFFVCCLAVCLPDSQSDKSIIHDFMTMLQPYTKICISPCTLKQIMVFYLHDQRTAGTRGDLFSALQLFQCNCKPEHSIINKILLDYMLSESGVSACFHGESSSENMRLLLTYAVFGRNQTYGCKCVKVQHYNN